MTVRQRERSGRKPKDSEDYQVGYGKPPRAHQFKKGQSGNPKGRPKGRKNDETLILEMLNEQLPYRENGEEKDGPAIKIVLKRLQMAAMEGNLKAIRIILDLAEQQGLFQGDADPQSQSRSADSPELLQLVNDIKEQLQIGDEE